MQVLASLLNPAATRQTQEIWQWLEQHCGLAGIKMTPLPHFSWQGADDYNATRVEEIIQHLTHQMAPFYVRAHGLGIFTGPSPVLFLSIVKTRQLLELHERIMREVEPEAIRSIQHYQAENWVPHITLAYRDVAPENLACAVKELAFRPIGFDILVDHLALIYEIEGSIGIKFRYDFSGSA